jgi:hypothetical protein
VMNPDEVKLKLYSRKVMDYVEEERTIHSTSENWSDGVGEFTGQTDTESTGGAVYDGSEQDARLWNRASAMSSGTSHTSMRGGAKSKTKVPFLKPVFGQELSSVQFRPLDEQLYRAMASLFAQKQRHGVARLVGMRAPVNVVTPIVEKKPTTKKMSGSFLTRAYQKLPFALPSTEAEKLIKDREEKIVAGTARADTELFVARRKIH